MLPFVQRGGTWYEGFWGGLGVSNSLIAVEQNINCIALYSSRLHVRGRVGERNTSMSTRRSNLGSCRRNQ